MSRLIQMRQRIKAIETTKKITHAMRLISMSAHTRLRTKNDALRLYKTATNDLFNRVLISAPNWQHPLIQPKETPNRRLLILISSQKGLCGNFNSMLFKFFELRTAAEGLHDTDIITVGKKAYDYIKKNSDLTILTHYDFNSSSLLTIAHKLAQTVLNECKNYNAISIFGNEILSFFSQRPIEQQLMPLTFGKKATKENVPDYSWEQPQHTILNFLLEQCLETNIQHRLFESLLAEQAARFVSMDNATRNANNLLESSKLLYNKLRQAKITKELTELTGSL